MFRSAAGLDTSAIDGRRRAKYDTPPANGASGRSAVAKEIALAQSIDARLLEIICARLCHDLVGPVSAIGNGVELVTEFGEDMRGEALALIAQSASEASRRLQFFRIAFGSAAGADGRSIPLAEARTRAVALPLGGRVSLDWPESQAGADPDLGRAALKLLLNLFLIAVDAAAGTGTVRVRVGGTAGVLFEVIADGARATLGDEVRQALEGRLTAAEATPRTAVAILACVLAAEAGIALGFTAETGRVVLSARRTGV
jgi:histidine phosphotransferase ChpT